MTPMSRDLANRKTHTSDHENGDTYQERTTAWLLDSGYDPKSFRIGYGVAGRGKNIMDHGFSVRPIGESRDRVLFGDPYEHVKDDYLDEMEDALGLEIRRYPGLWRPGRSRLLEIIVRDPFKACRFIMTYGMQRNEPESRFGRIIVGQAAPYLNGCSTKALLAG